MCFFIITGSKLDDDLLTGVVKSSNVHGGGYVPQIRKSGSELTGSSQKLVVDKFRQRFGRIGRCRVGIKTRESGRRQLADPVVIILEIYPTAQQSLEDTGQTDDVLGGMKPKGKIEGEQLGHVDGSYTNSNGDLETVRSGTDENDRKISVLSKALVLQTKVSYRIQRNNYEILYLLMCNNFAIVDSSLKKGIPRQTQRALEL